MGGFFLLLVALGHLELPLATCTNNSLSGFANSHISFICKDSRSDINAKGWFWDSSGGLMAMVEHL